jgi:hypothetical protein
MMPLETRKPLPAAMADGRGGELSVEKPNLKAMNLSDGKNQPSQNLHRANPFSPTDHAIKLLHCPLNDKSRVAPTRPAIPTPSNTIAFRGAPIHSAVNNPEIVAVMIMNI